MNDTPNNSQPAAVLPGGSEHRLLDALPTGALLTRFDGTILFANQAIAHLLGVPDAAALLGKPVPNFYWEPEDRQVVLQRFRAEGAFENHPVRVRRADETMFWAAISLRPFEFEGESVLLSTIVDINEQKYAEIKLQQLAAIVESSSDAILSTTPEGVVTSWNRAAEQMFGYTAAEMIGQPVRVLAPRELQESARDLLMRLAHGEQIPAVETVRLTKTGRRIDVLLSAAAMRDESGKVSGFSATLTNITERMRAEQNVHESEQRFRAFVANQPGIVFVLDRDGKFLISEGQGLTKLGLKPGQVVGLSAFDVYKDVPEIGESIRRALTGEAHSTTITLGSFVYESWYGPLTDEYGHITGMMGVSTDITERMQAEQRLHESELRLRTFVANQPGIVFVLDKEGKFELSEGLGLPKLGLQPGQVVGLSAFEVYKDFPEIGASIRRALAGEAHLAPIVIGPLTYDIWFGPLVDAHGQVTGLLGVASDVTERKQADLALRQEKAFSEAIVNHMPGTFFVLDTNGRFVRWNDREEIVTGYSKEELAQMPALLTIVEEDRERMGQQLEQVFLTGEGGGETEVLSKDGTRTYHQLLGSRLETPEGVYVLGMGIDITERKKLEQEIRESSERRGYQVQISTEISQEIASASELSDLFERIVTLTKERLGYYHTQLLRYDPAQEAVVLINGYGEIGQQMLAQGHQLPLGTGLIGTAASSGETILRSSLAEDPDWQPHPLLPETQGEIALPIKLGDEILGVLDIQSNQAGSLTEDDRLLLEGLCGQIAVAIEQTRLRQEMSTRLEEVNRLYRAMSHEGWKDYRDTAELPAGFVYDQAGARPLEEEEPGTESYTEVPMSVPGGEVVGSLSVEVDPAHPTTPEERLFLQQVSEQVALALESARLSAQTQSALAQTERLSEAGLSFARAANLQELLVVVNETLDISAVNRTLLGVFNYGSTTEVESMDIVANWWNGTGHMPSEVGRHYTRENLNLLPLFISATPIFFNNIFEDERVNPTTLELLARQNIHSMAVLPLFLGARQIGVLFLETEEIHNFTQNEIRLFSALAPQVATVLDNRRQFERAQKQAERESTLNLISQKIQSATTVEAVLQIAARELGHALGAPMTIAQLSMKDKK